MAPSINKQNEKNVLFHSLHFFKACCSNQDKHSSLFCPEHHCRKTVLCVIVLVTASVNKYKSDCQVIQTNYIFHKLVWKATMGVESSTKVIPGMSYWKGRLSTVDLLVSTCLNQLLFTLKILFSLFKKQANLIWRSIVLSLPPQLVFPGYSFWQLPSSHVLKDQLIRLANLTVSTCLVGSI